MDNETPNEYITKQKDFNETITKAILKLDKATRTQNEINRTNIEILKEQDSRITTHRQLTIINLMIATTAIITAIFI